MHVCGAGAQAQIIKRDPQMMTVKHILDLMATYRELQSWGNISRLYNTVRSYWIV